ncbi:MAG: hypothetical protein ACRDTC_22495 [Pseudonocardiaceae bacterium]
MYPSIEVTNANGPTTVETNSTICIMPRLVDRWSSILADIGEVNPPSRVVMSLPTVPPLAFTPVPVSGGLSAVAVLLVALAMAVAALAAAVLTVAVVSLVSGILSLVQDQGPGVGS